MIKYLVGFLSPLLCLKAVFWDLFYSSFKSMTFPQLLPHLFHTYLQMTPSVVNRTCHLIMPYPSKQILITSASGATKMNYRLISEQEMLLILTTPLMELTLIVSQEHCRGLGVIFSSGLSWIKHYHSITAKAYQTLGLIRQSFLSSVPTRVKKLLFLLLVKSRLTYCSHVWRCNYIKDISLIQQVQRRGTKYILNDFQSDYRLRLISLHLLPLVYTYELLDILFLVRNLQCPDPSLPISEFVLFSSSSTRAGHSLKFVHQTSHTHLSMSHSYFKRIVRLRNALSPIDLSLSLPTTKPCLKEFVWSH